MSREGAAWLEENDIFRPEDDDWSGELVNSDWKCHKKWHCTFVLMVTETTECVELNNWRYLYVTMLDY